MYIGDFMKGIAQQRGAMYQSVASVVGARVWQHAADTGKPHHAPHTRSIPHKQMQWWTNVWNEGGR
jgi:hypothetical protein